MADSKHTPGPWKADLIAPTCAYVFADSKVMATLRCDDAEHEASASAGQMMANAALIAAAPDLLAAMEIIAKELTNLGVHGRLPKAALAIVARLLGEARAAIAKAEGR